MLGLEAAQLDRAEAQWFAGEGLRRAELSWASTPALYGPSRRVAECHEEVVAGADGVAVLIDQAVTGESREVGREGAAGHLEAGRRAASSALVIAFGWASARMSSSLPAAPTARRHMASLSSGVSAAGGVSPAAARPSGVARQRAPSASIRPAVLSRDR